MSEYSESYHLRSIQKADAVRLLKRAGVSGLVFPPAGGWVTILAQGEPFVFNQKLLAVNEGPLLYYMSAEDHAWSFAACQADRVVSQYACNWDPELMIHDSQLRLAELSAWLREIGVKEPKSDVLEQLFHPQKENLEFDNLPSYRFAELLGLSQYRWSSFEYMIQEFDPDQPEFKGVVAVEADGAAEECQSCGYPFVAPAEKSDHPLLLPVLLHGDALTTKKNWRKITRRAWKQGNWNGILAELEMLPVEDLPGGICFQNTRMTPATMKCWRLHWIAELLKDAAWKEGGPHDLEANERFDSLMLEGMEHLWFVMGSLESNGGMRHMGLSTRRRPLREVAQAYLDRFVLWLPELESHWGWYRDELGLNSSLWVPLGNMLSLAYSTGRWLNLPEIAVPGKFEIADRGRLSAALIAAGALVPAGNRYRLVN